MSIFGTHTQTKNHYEINATTLPKVLKNINSNKQNKNKPTKLSTNQQYKIPQQLGKISSKKQKISWLEITQTEENQTPSFIQSPTFSKQSISETESEKHILTTIQQQTNTVASESTITPYKQACDELTHEMFEIWDKLK